MTKDDDSLFTPEQRRQVEQSIKEDMERGPRFTPQEQVEKRAWANAEHPELQKFDDTLNEWNGKLSGKSCKELKKISSELPSINADNAVTPESAKKIAVDGKLDKKGCHR
jgi:hypothetical protein